MEYTEEEIKAIEELKKYIMLVSCDGECHICEHVKNEHLLKNDSIPKEKIRKKYMS